MKIPVFLETDPCRANMKHIVNTGKGKNITTCVFGTFKKYTCFLVLFAWFLDSVVLVSAVQWCESAVCIQTHPSPTLPSGSSQSTKLQLSGLYNGFPLAIHFTHGSVYMGFPGGTSGKEPTCQCRRCNRHVFDPWVRKIPWRRAWQPTPVFLCGESLDRGAWSAMVHRFSKSWTQLRRLGMQSVYICQP